MRPQTGFAQSQNYGYMSQETNSTWHVAIAIVIMLVLIAAHASGVQSALSNEIGTNTINSDATATHPFLAESTIALQSDGNAAIDPPIKVTWPSKTLNERVEQINLKGRVVISSTSEAPQIRIRTDLLFSEGDGVLSRAGTYTLDKLLSNLELPSTTIIQLEERANTEVEFTHGVQMNTLHKNRESSLTEYLSASGLSVSIVQ